MGHNSSFFEMSAIVEQQWWSDEEEDVVNAFDADEEVVEEDVQAFDADDDEGEEEDDDDDDEDDDDPEDKKPEIEEACKESQCQKYVKLLEDCATRLEAADQKTQDEHDCVGYFFDMKHCIDKCAAPKIFAQTYTSDNPAPSK